MQKRIASILFSTRLMAVLFVVFAVALGLGTFIESWYSTETAKVWIYNALWFEVIMAFFVINFAGNIKRYQLYKREKWSSLLLHLAFLLILIGAFVTRYISYEGMMPIREGATENTFLSEKTFLTTYMDGEINGQPRRRVVENEVLLAPGASNEFEFNTDYNGQPVKLEILDYIHGAEEGLVEDPEGENYLKIVEAGGGDRHDHYIKEGEVTSIHNVLFALNKPTEGAINIIYEDGEYSISSPFEGTYMRMADQLQGEVKKDTTQTLMLRSLYNMAGMQFVLPDPVVKGVYDIIPTEEKTDGQQDAAIVRVTTKGESETVKLLGGQGRINDFEKLELGGLELYVRYGSKAYELPFAIKLNDFIAAKYPGTEKSYSSFKSKVTVIDEAKTFDYEIFMNHVLDHKGYRFFQASFDPDEKGTVLSVNHDFWGTWITYIGYTLLYIGLIWILFDRGSRFGQLGKMLKKVKKKKAKLAALVVVFFISASGFAQYAPAGQEQETETHSQDDGHDHASEEEAHEHENASFTIPKQRIDSIIKANVVTKEHAAKFGELVVQDAGGRMKPVNTYSSELLRKLSKSAEYEGLSPDQVIISMTENPTMWYNVPLINVKRGNDSIRHIAGVPEDQKYIALTSFFDTSGNYKLSPYLESAYQAAVPNQFQKDFIETDRRVNLLYNALQGKILRIFPIPEHENNKWVSFPEAAEAGFKGMDSVYTRQILPMYFGALRTAKETGDYAQANELLESIKGFQRKFGSEVIPSKQKIRTEILYNKYDIFRNLFWMYMLAGVLMLIFVLFQIFKDNKIIGSLIKVSKIAIIVLFLLHTAGLIARWYISGHAPWSDAYESMIYVAWATMLFGIFFGRKSDLTLASTAFVTSMILMISHWNWMDPSIANLQPVLDSYWLMIHVSIIVGSYGPFTLGMILGAVALILMILTTKKNKKKMDLTIKEITIITEMALTVGLVMLTIGNFLGGQWANESWGRYWGWDPKETWALVSIMVYAFVIHMRLVPGLRSRWLFNFMAVVSFASIMMTYFGVNFYLSGLHSYASGDKVITPDFVYYSVAIVALLGLISYLRFTKYYKKGNRNRLTDKFLQKKPKKKNKV
ncbi:cytochrome c-type biogenesis protein CcsB [Salinimicrobium catena]|uniref:Cytochrome c-type biogenesis protein CcsB n=1 Tax=Salinimicrobium catena TaxID=390640 RepID=A0A1H5KX05_9FLAO|nr:cytochrome c biogenesis protein CcsA [Salinimicrobium catena]SDL02462.1 cytochrome c-type biogenesis protein CcsB [Salinimicrobium catena]SEE68907.1 cytochrome c-type biogenesis protein CcsB [Salinimicrobium catena]